MLIEDRLGPGKVSRRDPDLGSEARNASDAGVQVVAEHLTANALTLERLLPDVGLKRVRCRGQARNLVLICRMHDIPPSHRKRCFGSTGPAVPSRRTLRRWSVAGSRTPE